MDDYKFYRNYIFSLSLPLCVNLLYYLLNFPQPTELTFWKFAKDLFNNRKPK